MQIVCPQLGLQLIPKTDIPGTERLCPPTHAMREQLARLREEAAAAAWAQYESGRGVWLRPLHTKRASLSNPGAVAALYQFARKGN